MAVEVQVNTIPVVSMLEGIQRRMGSLAPVFDSVVGDLQDHHADQFDSLGGRFGPGWPPLAASTRARKRGPQMMVESGALRASLTSRFGRGAVRKVTPFGVTFGTTIPYAAAHQYGTYSLPVRQVVDEGGGLLSSVKNAIERYIAP